MMHPGCTSGLSERTFSTASLFKIFIMCPAGLLSLIRGGWSMAGELESSSSRATSAFPTADKPLIARALTQRPEAAGARTPSRGMIWLCTKEIDPTDCATT
uniref:Uncharacterized protein n=1 Tax=Arundo donax TaxID=35708 RepID=A0A0A8Z263_ARUDO